MQQKGIGLMEIIIGIALLGIVGMGFSSLMVYMKQQQMTQGVLFNIEQMRRNVSILISNRQHWNAMVNENNSLECLRDNDVDCPHDSPMNFTIYTDGPVQFLDPETQGFTREGRVCNQGDSDCIITLDIAVTTKCAPTGTPPEPPSECANPSEILVEGRFEVDHNIFQGPLFAFNPENYLVTNRLEGVRASNSGEGFLKLTCSWNYLSLYSTCPCSGTHANDPSACQSLPCPSGFQEVTNYSYGAPAGSSPVLRYVTVCERQ